jgi:hypothetical protein
MKIALCFIISYEHILHKEELWIKWIQPNKDIINVYFHYKDFKQIKSPWIRARTIPQNKCQQTSYFHVVPAYLALLTFAFNHDTENMWFCMLTDSCVPIISPSKFRQLFLNHYQASIIKCKPAYWDITIHRRANLRLLKSDYWLANDPWFTLTRSHVHLCIIFLAGKYGIYKQVNDGGLANESLFAIILKTFRQLDNPLTHINEICTATDWSRMSNPTSPYLFRDATEENIDMICNMLKENKYTMFLRKVHRSFPNNKLEEIMNMNFDHEYPILHNHLQKRNNYTYMYFFLSLTFLLVWYYIKSTPFSAKQIMNL